MANSRESRFKAGIPAVFYYRENEYRCQAQNLSRTGVLLLGTVPSPASGETVRFRLDSHTGDLHLDLTGKVTRVIEDGTGNGTAVALHFGSLEENKREALETIIQRVIEGQSPDLLSGVPRDATARETREALNDIPVAHRISHATRTIQSKDREILLHDINPQVLEALARNPNLREPELYGLLKNTNLLSRTLEQISRDNRWKDKEDVLVEVIGHIRTPLPLADSLLQRLSRLALGKLAQKPGLSGPLLHKLRQKIR
jgi:hypothetical protein